jgi:hypothetical protein
MDPLGDKLMPTPPSPRILMASVTDVVFEIRESAEIAFCLLYENLEITYRRSTVLIAKPESKHPCEKAMRR